MLIIPIFANRKDRKVYGKIPTQSIILGFTPTIKQIRVNGMSMQITAPICSVRS